jgi:hypothetical protein
MFRVAFTPATLETVMAPELPLLLPESVRMPPETLVVPV